MVEGEHVRVRRPSGSCGPDVLRALKHALSDDAASYISRQDGSSTIDLRRGDAKFSGGHDVEVVGQDTRLDDALAFFEEQACIHRVHRRAQYRRAQMC
mgnify:CR=1 FL=1